MIGAIEMMKKPSYVNIQESSYDQNGIKKKSKSNNDQVSFKVVNLGAGGKALSLGSSRLPDTFSRELRLCVV